MSRPGNPLTDRRSLLVLFTVFSVVLLDQITKAWIRTYELGDVIYRLGFIRIIRTQNTGAAFGIFQDQAAALIIFRSIGVVLLLALAFWTYRRYPSLVTTWNRAAFSFILAGTLGNLIDGIRFGAVTDFIDPGFWPAFNVADSGISVGSVMTGVSLLRTAFLERK